jgi:hypothetical protein
MHTKKSREDVTKGYTIKEPIGCGRAYVTVNWNNGDETPIEVFATNGKKGGCSASLMALCRQLSLELKHGIPIDEILDQLDAVKCSSARVAMATDVELKKSGNYSCARAVANAIRKAMEHKSEIIKQKT